MNTINAQTIINQVMAAHAIAPSEYTWGDFITFRTSARGTHRIINDKSHLQRFADLVRKNASAFGGGLIREAKARPAVSYASKTISLYKQLIEDRDYFAALQLAEEKLSPMFFFGTHGKAYMQVAPITLEDEPRFVSTLSEDGRWAVIEPVSMLALSGDSIRNKRSRDAQVEHVMQRYSRGTDEQKEAMFSKAYAKPADQSAARAKWMADHGIIDDAAIEARIEENAVKEEWPADKEWTIEAWHAVIKSKADQDVAEVVAQAVAVSAISEAKAPAAEEDKELVTCEAGESEAQESSTGSASGFTVAAYNTVTAMLASFTPTHAPAVAVSSEPPAPVVGTEAEQAPKMRTVYEDYGPSDLDLANQDVADRDAANLATEKTDIGAQPVEPATTPDDYAKFNIRAKSGAWFACVYMIGTVYGLRFEAKGLDHITGEFATHKERMAALEMMAQALNTPPDGGQPIVTDTIQINANDASVKNEDTPPVAECTPDTPPMESRAEFERIKPFNMDPRKLLEHGVQAAQLIGLGVKYTGNMASSEPDGQGAITSVEDTRGEKFGSLRLNCTLEDGRVIRAEPHYFTAELRPILQFDGKMHGAPYLSELAMAATLAKSQRTSADELRKQAHDQALIDLAAQYPQLKRAETTYSGGKLAAQNIRILLKEAFKGQKFSVTSDYSEVRVNWTDGPTDAEVTEIIGRFDIGASDTQSDYFYTVETAFSELFGGVQYLWTKRETSDELVQQAIDALYSNRSNGKPKVDDYRKCTGIFDWNSQNYENRRMRETLGSISAYTAPKGKAKA